jgi:hypothetical protein
MDGREDALVNGERGHVTEREDCPNRAAHTEGPRGYLPGFEWRYEMLKTHKVSRCPDCLRFLIWTPKERSA